MQETMGSKKQNSSKSKPHSKSVPNKMLDRMIEEATVDAYGDSEQTTGFFTMLEDNLAVPFETEILGIKVTVEQVDITDEDQIVAVCSRGKSRQNLPLLELPLPDPPPKGAEWIAAYRRWARVR
jgi:hypothetical protein